jgi:hypothetical protein
MKKFRVVCVITIFIVVLITLTVLIIKSIKYYPKNFVVLYKSPYSNYGNFTAYYNGSEYYYNNKSLVNGKNAEKISDDNVIGISKNNNYFTYITIPEYGWNRLNINKNGKNIFEINNSEKQVKIIDNNIYCYANGEPISGPIFWKTELINLKTLEKSEVEQKNIKKYFHVTSNQLMSILQDNDTTLFFLSDSDIDIENISSGNYYTYLYDKKEQQTVISNTQLDEPKFCPIDVKSDYYLVLLNNKICKIKSNIVTTLLDLRDYKEYSFSKISLVGSDLILVGQRWNMDAKNEDYEDISEHVNDIVLSINLNDKTVKELFKSKNTQRVLYFSGGNTYYIDSTNGYINEINTTTGTNKAVLKLEEQPKGTVIYTEPCGKNLYIYAVNKSRVTLLNRNQVKIGFINIIPIN